MTTLTTCLSCVYITQSINIRAKPSCNFLPLINIYPNFQTKLLPTFCFTFYASKTSGTVGLNILYSEEKDWAWHTMQQCPSRRYNGTVASVSTIMSGRKVVGKIQTWVIQTGIHCRQYKMIQKLTLSMVCREFLNSNLDTMDNMYLYYGITQMTDCKFTPTLKVRNHSNSGKGQ